MSTKPTRLVMRAKGERERFQVTFNCHKNTQKLITFHPRISKTVTFASTIRLPEITQSLKILNPLTSFCGKIFCHSKIRTCAWHDWVRQLN